MAEKKKSKLLRKLQIAVFADNSYEQLFSLQLTPLSLVVVISVSSLLLIISVTFLIAFTSLREYIPGYPTGEERRMMNENFRRTDSIAEALVIRDKMLSNIREVLADEIPEEAFNHDSIKISRTPVQISKIKSSEADSIFRAQVEAEENYNVSSANSATTAIDTRLEMMFLFPPVKGIISQSYGERNGHWGVDVAVPDGTIVTAVLDGTVIFSEWTIETGFVIAIQHNNELVSVYKHNSKVLKRVGTHVAAGEVIALSGNSGELSTGPHLHFELWYSGVPLNPENYISFN